MSIFDKIELLQHEINKEVTKEEEDINYKINFIRENSNIKIKYNEIKYKFEFKIDDNYEVFSSFTLLFDYDENNYDNTSEYFINKQSYFNFKNRLDELYDKVKLQKDLTEKLKIKETKEKRSKI